MNPRNGVIGNSRPKRRSRVARRLHRRPGRPAGPRTRTRRRTPFNWLDDRESDRPSGQVYREALATGAVISGRRTFELAGRWQGDHHDGVPIFVLTRQVDDGDVPPGHARFVIDAEDCARQARAAAGGRPVMVHGAGAAQALLRTGLIDEMEIHLVPVLLGDGRPLFGHLGGDHIELTLVRRLEDRDVTHLRYRVRRPEQAA
jgi:dihydrofolate reductase